MEFAKSFNWLLWCFSMITGIWFGNLDFFYLNFSFRYCNVYVYLKLFFCSEIIFAICLFFYYFIFINSIISLCEKSCRQICISFHCIWVHLVLAIVSFHVNSLGINEAASVVVPCSWKGSVIANQLHQILIFCTIESFRYKIIW